MNELISSFVVGFAINMANGKITDEQVEDAAGKVAELLQEYGDRFMGEGAAEKLEDFLQEKASLFFIELNTRLNEDD